MKLFLLFSFFALCTSGLYGQETGYFDNIQRAARQESSEFARVITKKDTLFNVETSYPSGKLYSVLNYKDKELNILEGEAKYYYENGNIDSEGKYKNNRREGVWSFYYVTGKPNGNVFFKDGKIATASTIPQITPVKQYVDRFPAYRGGRNALTLYIMRTFKPLQTSRKEKITGTMQIGFIVTETGRVTNVHIVSGINDKIDRRAVRLISEMPTWHPGIRYNTPVKVPLIIPIVF